MEHEGTTLEGRWLIAKHLQTHAAEEALRVGRLDVQRKGNEEFQRQRWKLQEEQQKLQRPWADPRLSVMIQNLKTDIAKMKDNRTSAIEKKVEAQQKKFMGCDEIVLAESETTIGMGYDRKTHRLEGRLRELEFRQKNNAEEQLRQRRIGEIEEEILELEKGRNEAVAKAVREFLQEFQCREQAFLQSMGPYRAEDSVPEEIVDGDPAAMSVEAFRRAKAAADIARECASNAKPEKHSAR